MSIHSPSLEAYAHDSSLSDDVSQSSNALLK